MLNPQVLFGDRYVTIYKSIGPVRVKKLTATQFAYLENKIIRHKLRRICKADGRGIAILPQVIAKIVGCNEWPHYTGDLGFLWKLYQGGSLIYDPMTSNFEHVEIFSNKKLKDVDCHILQAATLEIFYKILESGRVKKCRWNVNIPSPYPLPSKKHSGRGGSKQNPFTAAVLQLNHLPHWD